MTVGVGAGAVQVVMARGGLLKHLVEGVLNAQCSGNLQTNFDLLGELVKSNPEVFHMLNQVPSPPPLPPLPPSRASSASFLLLLLFVVRTCSLRGAVGERDGGGSRCCASSQDATRPLCRSVPKQQGEGQGARREESGSERAGVSTGVAGAEEEGSGLA